MARETNRELVRVRDNHTCQKCGKKWVKGCRRFDVHHLNGLCGKKSKGYDKKEDMGGMITLCHKCHYSLPEHTIHSKGYKDNIMKTIYGINGYKKYLERNNKIILMRQQRFKLREIGEKFGISHERVRQILISPSINIKI